MSCDHRLTTGGRYILFEHSRSVLMTLADVWWRLCHVALFRMRTTCLKRLIAEEIVLFEENNSDKLDSEKISDSENSDHTGDESGRLKKAGRASKAASKTGGQQEQVREETLLSSG